MTVSRQDLLHTIATIGHKLHKYVLMFIVIVVVTVTIIIIYYIHGLLFMLSDDVVGVATAFRFLSVFTSFFLFSSSQFHNKGRIHGDVTPSNMLLLSDGVHPIDPLDMAVGSIAYAGTPGVFSLLL